LFTRELDEEGNESGRTFMLPVKNNLSDKRNNGISYRLASFDFGGGVTAPYVVWGEAVSITADQALAIALEPLSTGGGDGRTATDDAVAFLAEVLKDGPVPVTKIEESARAAGLLGASQRAGQYKPFRRAREELNVETYQPGGENGSPGWVWFIGTKSGQMP
jgi:hypothetical protein